MEHTPTATDTRIQKAHDGRTINSRGMGEVSNVTPIDLLGLQAPAASQLQQPPGSTDFLLVRVLLLLLFLLLLVVVLLLVRVLLLTRLRLLARLAISHRSEAFLQYI